jgi:general secretion pathway protein K
VENGRADTDVPDAVLSGGIEDAYARFNLIKLVKGGQPDAEQVTAFGRLLTSLQLSPGLALPTATTIAATLKPPVTPDSKGGNPGGGSTSQSTSTNTAPQFMEFRQVDDLLAVPGFTPEILEKLRKYVIVLPLNASTKVNVNTASAEVLSATFPNLSVAEANTLVAARKGRAFTSTGDQTLVSLLKNSPDIGGKIQVNSDYFLVYGKVRLNRAGMEMQTLVKRNPDRSAQVIWIREF